MAAAIHHHSALGATAAAARFPAPSSAACRSSSRVSYYVINGWSLLANELTGSARVESVDGAWNGRESAQVVAQAGRSGRSALYGDGETYVLMEPGEDEQFVSAEELQARLKKYLQEWPGEELPIDLTKFKNVDAAVQFLVNAVCELDLGDGQGSLQWYEVRLDDA